jgi:hypothetical protein
LANFFQKSPQKNIAAWRQDMAKGLHFIQNNPYYGSMFTEVAGCNIPKFLMVAGPKERCEQFIMQFFNTLGIWGFGAVYDKFLEKVIFKSSRHYEAMMKGKGSPAGIQEAKEWHAIGKTLGLFGWVVPWMFTLPFFRNAFTVWQSGATNFAQMSGLQSYDRKDPKHHAEEQKALHKDLGIFIGSNLTGLGIGLVGALAARRGMENAIEGKAVKGGLKALRNAVRGFDKGFKALPFIGSKDPDASVLFKDGQFSNFDGLPLVVSWILPGYLGYLASMRDPVEAFENIMATCIALFSFEAGPTALRRFIETSLKNNPNHPLVRKLMQNLGGVKNTGQLSKMLISASLYGMLPTGLSLITRPLRAKWAGMNDQGKANPSPIKDAKVSPEGPEEKGQDLQPDITQEGLPELLPSFGASPMESKPLQPTRLYQTITLQPFEQRHRQALPLP